VVHGAAPGQLDPNGNPVQDQLTEAQQDQLDTQHEIATLQVRLPWPLLILLLCLAVPVVQQAGVVATQMELLVTWRVLMGSVFRKNIDQVNSDE